MSTKIERNAEIQEFIIDWLRKPGHFETSAVDTVFHDEFSVRFEGTRIWKNFGAQPNLLAMRWLKKLYDQGILRRGIVGLPEMGSGFPKWVYVYYLPERDQDANQN